MGQLLNLILIFKKRILILCILSCIMGRCTYLIWSFEITIQCLSAKMLAGFEHQDVQLEVFLVPEPRFAWKDFFKGWLIYSTWSSHEAYLPLEPSSLDMSCRLGSASSSSTSFKAPWISLEQRERLQPIKYGSVLGTFSHINQRMPVGMQWFLIVCMIFYRITRNDLSLQPKIFVQLLAFSPHLEVLVWPFPSIWGLCWYMIFWGLCNLVVYWVPILRIRENESTSKILGLYYWFHRSSFTPRWRWIIGGTDPYRTLKRCWTSRKV